MYSQYEKDIWLTDIVLFWDCDKVGNFPVLSTFWRKLLFPFSVQPTSSCFMTHKQDKPLQRTAVVSMKLSIGQIVLYLQYK